MLHPIYSRSHAVSAPHSAKPYDLVVAPLPRLPIMSKRSAQNATHLRSPTYLRSPTHHRHHAKMSSNSETDYASWTPEELMRDYRGEIKRDIFVRCIEWYTNAEVEAKINANRTDGKKIQNPNFYAEIKRNIDNIALRDGHLPTEYRLQYDKRRLASLKARLGSDSATVRMMRQSITAREVVEGELTSHALSAGTTTQALC